MTPPERLHSKRHGTPSNDDSAPAPAPDSVTVAGNATSPTTSAGSFAARVGKAPAPHPAEPGADSYKAYELARGELRPFFELRLKDEISYGMNYSYLQSVRFQSKKTDSLTLYTHFGRIKLTGRHLRELKEQLYSQKVIWVQLFDDTLHQLPNHGEPVISDITISDSERTPA